MRNDTYTGSTRTDDAGHPCAREEWCSARTITRASDGTATIEAARTYQAFCATCTTQIEICLRELPPAYLLLGAELGQMPRTGEAVRSPFGPRTALREDVDALMRTMAATLRSWEARTRATASLTPPRPFPVHSPESVREAVKTLAAALGTLLALQDGWMTRTFPLAPGRHGQPATVSAELLELHPDAEITRVGVDSVTIMDRFGGKDAGLEILRLHRRAQAILGQAAQRPDLLDGVPCRRDDCGDYALERAPAPASPSQPAMWSRCATCRDQMDQDEYALWVSQWASWAGRAGPLVCHRCQQNRCGECSWGACTCRASGHATAA